MTDFITPYIYQSAVAMLILCGPILAVAAAAGLMMGLLQAITQIQDQTLPQIIKILVVSATVFFLGFKLSSPLMEFSRDVFNNFHTIVR
jgi:type III secretion protein S